MNSLSRSPRASVSLALLASLCAACQGGGPSRQNFVTSAATGSRTSAPGPGPGPSSGSSGTPLQIAQAFVANLTMGIHQPRGQQTVLTYNGTPIYQSLAFYQYLASLGVSHIAMSYPWTPLGSAGGDLSFVGSPSTGDGYFSSQIAAAKLANQAGLKVIHRLTDNLQVPGDFGSTLNGWLSQAAQAIAGSGLNPSMNLIVPWGEMAGSTNAQCNPLANSANQLLRQYLPQSGGWILGVGGAYWQSSSVINGDSSGVGRAVVTLPNGQQDFQVVYMFDDYPSYNQGVAATEGGIRQNASQWQQAHGGVPLIHHETADWLGQTQYDSNPGNPGAWASGYLPIAQGDGQYAATLWDMSNSDGNMNMSTLANGTEATLSSANASALQAACASIRSQSYFGNGAVR